MSVFYPNKDLLPMVQIYKIGHNLGLAYSGEGSNSYGN